jgi:hypothetical protein
MRRMSEPGGNEQVSWSQWFGGAALASVVLLGLEYMVDRSLAPVERGEPPTTAVWAPIATVYELWGFGAAMSIIPALWLVLMGIVAWQTWRRIKAERQRNNNSAAGRAQGQ